MNIKKKKLYLEISPVTYQGKQYTCIVSGRKNFIFWIVRIIILIIAIIAGERYVLIGALEIELDCCIFSIENENHDKVKAFQTKIALLLGDWNDIVKTSNYEYLTKLIFKEYNIYQGEEFELNRQKNWDGIIS